MPHNAIEYMVRECYVDTELYDKVYVNGVESHDEVTGKAIAGSDTRKVFDAEYASVISRPEVKYINHVNQNKLNTLTITKKLFDETGETPIINDDEVFTFRLYLGTETDEDISEAQMHNYHIRDPHGVYCYWDVGEQRIKPLPSGIDTHEALVASTTDRARATFTSSLYGSISNIPVGYTVEIRELLSGTRFMVEERGYEIPDGYSLKEYAIARYEVDEEGSLPTTFDAQTITRQVDAYTLDDIDYNVEVRNMKGWGLRMYKKWSDAAFMESRDPVFFAVYIEGEGGTLTLIDGTVRRMNTGEESLYWYFDSLRGTTFDKFVVREVKVSGSYEVADDGTVTGSPTVTPINGGRENSVIGLQKGDAEAKAHDYTVRYSQGTTPVGDNIRKDTVTNSRPGIRIVKEDMDGAPLPGAEFTLTDENGDPAGVASYISDEDGLVTTAYLRSNEEYTLTEISAPAGYQAVTQTQGVSYHATVQPLKIKLLKTEDVYNVSVTGGDYSNYYELTDPPEGDDAIKILTVRNKQYELDVKKVNADGDPLEGVKFALYKEVKGQNGYRMDYLPLNGFEELVTEADGTVPLITDAFSTGALQPGTYYLVEKEPVDEYRPLEKPVLFTVSKAGRVTIGSPRQPDYATAPDWIRLTDHDSATANHMSYDMEIVNYVAQTSKVTVNKIVDGNTSQADTDTDNKISKFYYTAVLYMPDGKTVWNYNVNGFTKGKTTFVLSHEESKELEVPVGGVLSVTERSDPCYTTKYRWYLDSAGVNSATDTTGPTCVQTIPEADSTMQFTNTRQTVKVTIQKNLDGDPIDKSGTFDFTGTVTDYGVDITDEIAGSSSFSITGAGKKEFNIPMGATFNVEEIGIPDHYTVTYSDNNDTSILSSQTITVRNTRKKQTVTISKTLNDSLITEPIDFPFTVTLYRTDGTTPVRDLELFKIGNTSYKTGKNDDNAGMLTFKLTVANGQTASQTLNIPYDAVLKVSEDPNAYNTVIVQTTGEESLPSINHKETTITVTEDTALAFTNSKAAQDVDLTITKNVTGLLGDKSSDFTFRIEVDGASEDDGYAWSKNGEDQAEPLKSGDTFTLRHDGTAAITVPANKVIKITETAEGYTKTFTLSENGTVIASDEDHQYDEATARWFTLQGDTTLAVTNTLDIAVPTGTHLPEVSVIFAGVLALGAVFLAKRERIRVNEGDNESDDDI